jgi:hypothetical protein
VPWSAGPWSAGPWSAWSAWPWSAWPLPWVARAYLIFSESDWNRVVGFTFTYDVYFNREI